MQNGYIFTYHRPYNYGAVLQSLASLNAFDSMGIRIKIVDYRDPRIEYERHYIKTPVNFSPYEIKKAIRAIYLLPVEVKRHLAFDLFERKNYKLTSACKSLEDIEKVCADADFLISGSDLIWNWELNKVPSPVFFLQFFLKKKVSRISYASSMGSRYIPDDLVQTYKKYLESYNKISVREESCKSILEKLTDKEIQVVLDPVLLFDHEYWNRYRESIKLPEKYICVYDVEYNPELDNIVKYVHSILKIPVVHFGYRKRYVNNEKFMYTVGPGKFLDILSHSQIVITNSFHGVAFSIIYNRNLWCVPHSTRGARMIDLMNKLGMDDRIVYNLNSDMKKDRALDNINYESINKKLDEWRALSWSFIKEALLKKL